MKKSELGQHLGAIIEFMAVPPEADEDGEIKTRALAACDKLKHDIEAGEGVPWDMSNYKDLNKILRHAKKYVLRFSDK